MWRIEHGRQEINDKDWSRPAGLTVSKAPRKTWRGTPLHELWLEDPDGNLVEVYARLTSDELAEKPESLEPTALA